MVQPVFTKDQSIFENENDLQYVRQTYMGCKVSDVLYLRSSLSLFDLHILIDKRIHFEFPEFDDECTYFHTYVNKIPFNFEIEPDESMAYHNRVLTRTIRAPQRAIISALKPML